MELDNETRKDIISQIKIHMSDFFIELKVKLVNPEYDCVRTMVVSDSQAASNARFDHIGQAVYFAFETEKRYDYLEMLDILEIYGFIEMTDEISSVIYFYRITDEFIELVLGS